jgi:DNA polymerase-3 subunit gamma/tau
MSYIALARKWRPKTFLQLVGQEHVNKALSNSLSQNRLHHAYLFTGTRGVGKTSVARLLAKALNCETGISATPCLQCETCLAIEQGRFMDLIEIDGASRTRVEDTRELLDNVQYLPSSGRFKIYLIDEVHMLSQHSFNALLKTLEEPPAHVKFLLATTDPQKLPVTVLSRCLQFNLKPLRTEVIAQQLELILTDENMSYDREVLDLLSKAADGSMRDALSLLDQMIASSDNNLRTQDVKNMLGYTQQDYALRLLQTLAIGDAEPLMSVSRHILSEGGQYPYVINEMLNYLHQISVHQNIPNTSALLRPSEEVVELAQQFSPEDVQLLYHIAIKTLEDISLAPTLGIGFEMMLLRMHTFRPAILPIRPPLRYEEHPRNMIASEQPKRDLPIASAPHQPPVAPNDPIKNEDWTSILQQLNLSGLALNAAENAEWMGQSGSEVSLRVAKRHLSVFTASVVKRIEQALANYYKHVVKLNLISEEMVLSSPAQQRIATQKKMHNEAATALEKDPFFQQLQEEFSADLVKNSIAPMSED